VSRRWSCFDELERLAGFEGRVRELVAGPNNVSMRRQEQANRPGTRPYYIVVTRRRLLVERSKMADEEGFSAPQACKLVGVNIKT